MLAARLNVRTRELRVEDVPVPVPGPGQVLVKVEASGVCLSDVHLVDGGLTPAFLDGDTVTLGHEVAGVIDSLGPGVTGWTPGDRVALQAGELRADGMVITRGVDYDGGWAEYAVATTSTLVALPDGLPFEQAAIIPDAVSTPWAAITATADARPARPAGVWGVGGLGAHGVQLLRMIGALPIVAVDPLPAARDRALELGADLALDPAEEQLADRIREVTGGAGLATAFDFVGVPAVREQAAGVLGQGGKLVLVGLSDQPLTLTRGTRLSFLGQQVLGHYGSGAGHVEELVALAAGGRLNLSGSISGRLPLADAPKAVEQLERKIGNPIRLVLTP